MAIDAGVLVLRGAVGPVGEGPAAPGRVGTKVRRHRRPWVPENRGADDHMDVYPDDLGCRGAKVQYRPGQGRGLVRLAEVMPTPGFLVHCTSFELVQCTSFELVQCTS